MSEICRMVKEKTSDMAGLGQKLANKCRKSSKEGLELCSQNINQRAKYFHQLCDFDLSEERVYDPARHTCGQAMIDFYVQKWSEQVVPLFSSFETVSLKAGELERSAKDFLKSSLAASQCEQSAGLSCKLSYFKTVGV